MLASLAISPQRAISADTKLAISSGVSGPGLARVLQGAPQAIHGPGGQTIELASDGILEQPFELRPLLASLGP